MWFGTCAGEGPPVAREGWPPGYPGSWAGRPTARRSGADPRRPRPTPGRAGSVSVRPNQSRQTGVAYARRGRAGGWRHRFILDVLARKCIAYRFGALPAADVAAESPVDAVAKPGCPGPTAQRGNGSRYAGKKFRKAASGFGIGLKFVWKGTPRQSGHVESFRDSLECIWPHDFADYQQAGAAIAAAFGEHDRARPRSALRHVPPEEFHASREGINEAAVSAQNRAKTGLRIRGPGRRSHRYIRRWRPIPMAGTRRHEVFAALHSEDGGYKGKFVKVLGDRIVDRSVGDVDARLKAAEIRDDFIADAAVTAGRCAWRRKHAGREIGAGLTKTAKDDGYGLLCVLLPPHSDCGKDRPRLMPPGLASNSYGGDSAAVRGWARDKAKLAEWTGRAFGRRSKDPPPNNGCPPFAGPFKQTLRRVAGLG